MTHPAQQLAAAGFHLDVLASGQLKVEPVQLLTPEWARFIRAHKEGIVERVIDSRWPWELFADPLNPDQLSARALAIFQAQAESQSEYESEET